MNKNFWELIVEVEGGDDGSSLGRYIDQTFRAKVPGGWLVRTVRAMDAQNADPEGVILNESVVISESMIFLPDPGKDWILDRDWILDKEAD